MTIIKYYKNLTIILLFVFFTMSCSKPNNANNIDNAGFTLTELVVVVAVLSALASFSIPNLLNSFFR